MKNTQAFLVSAAAVIALSGCKREDSAQPIDAGYEYFPLKVGSWIEYQVDSVWRDDTFDLLDSTSYRLKHVVAANYLDPEGRPSQRIERFKLNANDEWVIRDVWTATRTIAAMEVTEENVRRLKLSFPLREGRTWDTNIYNDEDELTVAARDLDQSYQLGDHSFTKTMVVRSTVAGNPISTRDLEERYAHGIGMIEHHWYTREAPGFVDTGVTSVRYDMVMLDHGVE